MEAEDKACDMSTLIQDKSDLAAIKLYAHQICSEYLGGAWKRVKLNEFMLTRLRCGFFVFLFSEFHQFKQI